MIVKKIITVIQVLLLLIFLACATYVGKYFYDAHKAQEEFEVLKTEVYKNTSVDASGNYEEKYADNGMLLQYYDLYNENNDLAGWIRIPDTPVDYPVMRTENNEYYLHKDFYRNYQYAGIPFLDYQSDDSSLNHIIYAHNMKNGTMFAAIAKYDRQDFYENHKKIFYDTLHKRGKYEIISVFRTKVGAKNEFKYYEYAYIDSEERFNEYVKEVKERSEYDADAEVSYGDRLLTLSTCAYHTSNERIVIVAAEKGLDISG